MGLEPTVPAVYQEVIPCRVTLSVLTQIPNPLATLRMTPRGVLSKYSCRVNLRILKLRLVFGIDGITEGATGKAMPVNVTIIREERGEFYGTMGGQVCEVDVTEHLALSNNDKALRPYRLEARGRCKGPVPAVAGDGEVRIAEFSYTGIVVWQDTPAEDEDKKVETKRTKTWRAVPGRNYLILVARHGPGSAGGDQKI